jgi:hypothetical protein
MATKAAQAVTNYLLALKDPNVLRDDELIAKLNDELTSATDPVARVELRQQIANAQDPALDSVEEAFVTHAKAWADKAGISAAAFAAEGVDRAVLRRAGFSIKGLGTIKSPRRHTGKRVTSDQVRAAIPKGTFTTKSLQGSSGASAAVVRKVITEEVQAGNLTEIGPDPDHSGPGRAPVMYRR